MSRHDKKLSRRMFVSGASVALLGAGCSWKRDRKAGGDSGTGFVATSWGFKDSLYAAFLLVGPWTKDQEEHANDFFDRFVADEKRVEQFKPHAEAISRLVTKLAVAGGGRLDKIDLSTLSDDEASALDALLIALYSVEELRFLVAGEPAAGVCMVDLGFLSKVPSST